MSTSESPTPKRPLSLGVIFLTLYIDLVGFSIIFPLGPDLLKHYLAAEGDAGILGWLLVHVNSLAHALGNDGKLPEVLFGGVISSVFSILQFIFAPFWGSLSDKHGRRPLLLLTVGGTAASYLLWAFSGSFWVFLIARMLAGCFGGNISVATAAVADVTTREERSKAMGIVGAAFGLGLVTGPLIGAFSSHLDASRGGESGALFSLNPFSTPALIAFSLGLVNLVWVGTRFHETLRPAARGAAAEPRLRNPLRAILGFDNPAVRGINLVAFLYALAFVAMEASLVFVSAERFGYSARQNGQLMGFLGVCSIITQGYIVRKLLGRVRETSVLFSGLAISAAGLLLIGFASVQSVLYLGVGLLALGNGLVNPATTGLISLYARDNEQGRVLGIYRSLGSLARAVTPMTAGMIYYAVAGGSHTLYALAAGFALIALVLGRKLPQPTR